MHVYAHNADGHKFIVSEPQFTECCY